ncbi:MAG: glycosyltransferase family 4 protein [Candidatus Omnitrophica bacterium]|nr:glycosyltransferase family 4 protein [Candidatus Omnitrophota bacterium]
MSHKKFKILHIITHLELGGAQKTTLRIIQGLNQQVFEIHLLTSPFGYLVKELHKIEGVKFKLIPALRRELNLLNDIIAFLIMLHYIRKNQFDIVHTHSPKAGFLGRWSAKLAGVPHIIHTVHGFPFYDKENFFLRWLYILAEKLTAGMTSLFIVVCESDRIKGVSARIGSKEKYVLIREGIEINRDKIPSPNISRDRLGIADYSHLIGMVACLKAQKAPLDFVKMAYLVKQRFSKAKFALVGGGPLYGKVERLVKKLNLENNLFIFGWREDACELISLFDIFVLTSVWEGLPLVILEAMALKKPIVATKVDGIKELIKDGENGFLIEPGDYSGFAQKVILLLEDENLRKKISESDNSKILSQFNLDLMVKQTENLYLNLMEGGNVH